MRAGNDKTNLWHISITSFFAIVVGGMSLIMQHNLSEELAKSEVTIVPKIIMKPGSKLATELDKNFLAQVNVCLIPSAAVYGYTLRVTSGFRSLDEQARLFDQGRVEDGHIVSWAAPGKSIHNYGYAVDVVDRWRGYNINWKRLARIAEFCGLTQVDDAHFEYRGGLTTDQFEIGLTPAPFMLPCGLMGEKTETDQPLTLQDLRDCGAPDFLADSTRGNL